MKQAGIRGKFKVLEITQYHWSRRAAYVKLDSLPMPDGQQFAASISIMITDPELIDSFPLGEEIYVDFSPVNL